jgi:hypothetical protein
MPPSNNEESKYITEIKTEEEFNQLLKRSKAILYFQVDWSIQERSSRSIIAKAITEIGVLKMPVYKINASEQDQVFVVDWITTLEEGTLEYYYDGSGGTLFLKTGKVIDYIRYPAQLGLEKLKEKIKSWQNG